MRDSRYGLLACVLLIAMVLSGPGERSKASSEPPKDPRDPWFAGIGFEKGRAEIEIDPDSRQAVARIRWLGKEYTNRYLLPFLEGQEILSWEFARLESRRVLLSFRCQKGDEYSVWAAVLYVAHDFRGKPRRADIHCIYVGPQKIEWLAIGSGLGAFITCGTVKYSLEQEFNSDPEVEVDLKFFYNGCPWPIGLGGLTGTSKFKLITAQEDPD